MELFLWLYFYDNRWLFNLKVPVNIYKYIWILPICIHSILISAAIYYLQFAHNFVCSDSVRIQLYQRTMFSFLICLNIIIFMVKITHFYEKENNYFSKAKRVFPILNHRIQEYDYWIRRNSLFSTSGMLLLFQSIISFVWSFYYAVNNPQSLNQCNSKFEQIFDFHSDFIAYSNCLVLLMIALMVTIKVFFFLTGVFFLKLLIKLAHSLHCNTSKLILYFDTKYQKKKVSLEDAKKLEITVV